MTKHEWNKQSDSDLQKALREKRKELQQFRFGSAGSRTRNVKEGQNLRKTVARILTELTKRHKEQS